MKSREKEGDGRGREEEEYRQPLPDFLHGDKAAFNRPGRGAKFWFTVQVELSALNRVGYP